MKILVEITGFVFRGGRSGLCRVGVLLPFAAVIATLFLRQNSVRLRVAHGDQMTDKFPTVEPLQRQSRHNQLAAEQIFHLLQPCRRFGD